MSASTLNLAGMALYGGAGDQRGTAVAAAGDSIFVSGDHENGTYQAGDAASVVLKYSTLLGSDPDWARPFGFGTNFFGIAASDQNVYAVGDNYSRTIDNVGGHENKSLLVNFAADGSSGTAFGGADWISRPNFFAYTGVEAFQAATTAVENGSTFIYAAGRGQPGSYQAFFVAKYDSSGNLLGAATDSMDGISFNNIFGSYETSSDGAAVTVYNGQVYVTGGAHPLTNATQSNAHPTIWAHDSNLNPIWRVQDVNNLGYFEGITGLSTLVVSRSLAIRHRIPTGFSLIVSIRPAT